MSGNRRPPQARDRMLGMHLRQHRKEHGLTLEAASVEARLSPATMSRIETGKRHITPEDVAALLALYRVAPNQRTELIAAARGGHRPFWWTERTPGWDPDILPICTTTAHTITEFALNAIPTTLQTRRYGHDHLRACGTTDINAAWTARASLREHRAFLDQTYFIHETALHTPYGGPTALREQLHHLHDAHNQGIGIRLVPTHTPLGSLNHSWTMIEYPDSPPMVYVELHHGALFLHEPTTTGYHHDLTQLRNTALTTHQTRTYLADLARRL